MGSRSKIVKPSMVKRALLHLRLKGNSITRLWHAKKNRWATAREKQLGCIKCKEHGIYKYYIYIYVSIYIYIST